MHLVTRFWTSVTYVVSFLTLSPVNGPGVEEQAPLRTTFVAPHAAPHSAPHAAGLRGPIFKPPSGRLAGPGSNFTCNYTQMTGWSECSTEENRGCWLRKNSTGEEFNISTNYETQQGTPNGTNRVIYMNISDASFNADGVDFTEAKLFDLQYPGPWIQACWGDTVTVIVTNYLAHNGTSIHWHGIRQLKTMHMDGVNGVTQCPIAPTKSFNYTWTVMQYGSSWYHSHYSVQYADGAVGPMTLHGPSTADYDEAKTPILMTDWGHNSAFEAIFTGLNRSSILLNGVGAVNGLNSSFKNDTEIPTPYTITFDPPRPGIRAKRYLLRLINTSFDSTFVFSIDNHWLQIIGADFVPIHPYLNTSVLVGIGQRYHVIVTAFPDNRGRHPPFEPNYWIRTWKADCFRFNNSIVRRGYEKTGILRYDAGAQHLPQTHAWPNISLDCSDETYDSLQPYLNWTVGVAANDRQGNVGENFTVQGGANSTIFPLAFFSMDGDDINPLKVDFGNPTFLNLNYTGKWNPLWAVVPENYNDTDWVYLVFRSKPGLTFGAHPIHLHGHDFAILQQVGGATFPDRLNLKLDNPPRRDVVLLPNDGYVVIAFKPDNPGSWLVHCHIATHASLGLGMQIMERQHDAIILWPDVHKGTALRQVQDGCNEWNEWWGDCNNWWAPEGQTRCLEGSNGFEPGSGV